MRSALSVPVESDWGKRAADWWQIGLRRSTRSSRLALLLFPALLVLLWAHRSSPWTLGGFCVGVCVFFLLPGYAIVTAARLRTVGDELLALSLGLGLCASNLAFTAAAWARLPWLYWLCPLAAAVYLASKIGRHAPSSSRRRFPIATTPVAWLVIALVAALLTHSSVHARDFVHNSEGVKLVGWPDGTLHAAIAGELSHTFPPRNPFLSDQPLVYHYATGLSAVVFCKFLGLPTTDVCLRLMPTMFMSLTVLSVFALVRRLSRSTAAALVTPLLILLGEDFSYLPGLWKGSSNVWAAEYFSSPSVFGLYFANPSLPGLAALSCSLLALSHAVRGNQTRLAWTGVTAAILALAASYKVFFGIQALVAIVALALFTRGARRAFAVRLLVASGVAVAIWLGPTLLSHRGHRIIELVPTLPRGYLGAMLGTLGLSDNRWLSAATRLLSQDQVSALGIAEALLLTLPVFVLGTMGPRLLGAARLLRSICRPSSELPVLGFLGWFVLSGYALGLLLRVTPIDYPDEYNNSVWFFVASKLLAWIFVGLALGRLFRTWSPPSAAWTAALLVALLAAPSTINTFVTLARTTSISVASPDEASVAKFFAARVAPGSSVLCDSSPLRRLLLGEARMRVPLAPEFYLMSFLRRSALDTRTQDIADFWRAWNVGTLRSDLTTKYRVDYVVSSKRRSGATPLFETATRFVYAAAR